MSYHADRGGKSSFEKNSFKVLQRTCAHQTRRAVTFSTITLDLWGIFAIDFHRNKPKL